MKKIITILLFIFAFSSFAVAGSGEDISIPTYTIQQLMALSQSKQAKVDIIKKNNDEIESYKEKLSTEIVNAAAKIKDLKLDSSENSNVISDEKLAELRTLLAFLQETTQTLNDDVATVSKEIDEILDLIIAKGMQLEQYDQIIEKQNNLIVKMKNILANVEKI